MIAHRFFSNWAIAASIAATSAAAVFPGAAWALGVTPVTVTVEAVGRRASTQINVSNGDAANLPVELVVTKVELQPNGEVKRTPAPDQFLILPPQAVVPPGGVQVFRVQYVGDPALAESQAFEIAVDQVPVQVEQKTPGAMMQIVYSIGALAVVAPPGTQSKVSIERAEIVKNDKGESVASISFHNDGQRHAFLSEGRLKVSVEDKTGKKVWDRSFDAEQVRQEIGVGYLPPHFTRTLQLPFALPVTEGKVTVSFNAAKR